MRDNEELITDSDLLFLSALSDQDTREKKDEHVNLDSLLWQVDGIGIFCETKDQLLLTSLISCVTKRSASLRFC